MEVLNDVIDWCNQNAGFLALLIFVVGLGIAWAKGLFRLLLGYLRNKNETSRVELLERKLALREQMQRDFLKPNYFKECYGEDRSEMSKHPWKKFISDEIWIRDIEDDTYPDAPDSRGISPFFKLVPVDFYHNGIAFWGNPQHAIVDDAGNWALNAKNEPNGFRRVTVQPVYSIPFSGIVNYDLTRDEFGYGPTIYCKFDRMDGSPYAIKEYEVMGEGIPRYLAGLSPEKRFEDSLFGWTKFKIRWLWENAKGLVAQPADEEH